METGGQGSESISFRPLRPSSDVLFPEGREHSTPTTPVWEAFRHGNRKAIFGQKAESTCTTVFTAHFSHLTDTYAVNEGLADNWEHAAVWWSHTGREIVSEIEKMAVPSTDGDETSEDERLFVQAKT